LKEKRIWAAVSRRGNISLIGLRVCSGGTKGGRRSLGGGGGRASVNIELVGEKSRQKEESMSN